MMKTDGNNSMLCVSSLQELDCPPGTVTKGVWQLGGDTTGMPDGIPLIVLQGVEAGPTLWIQGCIHGDEPNAAWVVSALAQEVDPRALKGRLILLPALNIAAFRARCLDNPIDNGQLYRGFPGNSSGASTPQLAHAIGQDLLKVADWMIDVHSGTSIYFCTDFASFPGGLQASEKAEEMALATGSPIVVRREVQSEGEKSIMFMYACSQGIPSLMISNGGHRRVEPQFYRPLMSMCLNVMRYLKMIPGDVKLADRSAIMKGINYTFCTQGGFVFYEAENGDWLVRDQVVARLYNIWGDPVEVIRCPYDRAKLIEKADGVVYAGELIAEWFLPAE